jgi:hypothetical protein
MLRAMAEAVPPDEVSQLRDEVEQLRAANSKLARRVAWRARLRRSALVLLLVLGCVFAGASVVAIWTRVTVLNTDRYVKTMAPIARSPAVQGAVADKLNTAINSRIDFDALARQVLPDRADILAPAIATGVQTTIRNRINEFVHSDRFPQLWDDANRRAHERVVALLTTGSSKRLKLEGDTVYLDMSAVVNTVKDKLRERGLTRVADAIPASVNGQIALLSSSGFTKARDGIHRLERLSIILPILAVLALLAHILLSDSKRRAVLRVGLGLALTALLLLAAIGIARTLYLDAINQAVLPRQAAQDIFDNLIVVLRAALRIAVLSCLVIAGLALLAGKPMRVAIERTGPAVKSAAARVAADPRTDWVGQHRTAIQWGIVVFGGLVLVAWNNPTAVVVLIDAALIGVAVWLVAALARSGQRAAG